MRLLLLTLLPALAGGLAFALRARIVQRVLLIAVALAHAALTASCWVLPAGTLGAAFGLDALGLLFLSLTSGLFLAAALYSLQYLSHHAEDESAAHGRYIPCMLLFLSAMTLVTATEHLGLLWAAIEATTLASAPLIYFHRRKTALEATWKYLLICSVGIALALLGTFFVGIGASGLAETPPLTVTALAAAGPSLALPWLKAGFVLALVGYGTKMGLAPLHTWLPDAHSQAPSPVSSLLSGALLNCALLGILRFHQLCVGAGLGDFSRALFVVLGIISLAVASAFLIGQRDYKRLLAYSSVENMGIIAIGVGLGGAATFGALLHAVNHSIAKGGLFLVAGNLLASYGTTSAPEVRGAARRLPVSGALLVLLMLAVGGSPPFGAFISELTIFRGALAQSAWLGWGFAALIAIAFLGLAGTLLPMAQGRPTAENESGALEPREREAWLAVAPSIIAALLVLVLGFYVPPFLAELLEKASALVSNGAISYYGGLP